MGAIQRLFRENQSTRTSGTQNPAPNNVPAPANPANPAASNPVPANPAPANPAPVPANPTPQSPTPAPQPVPAPANPAPASSTPANPVPANPALPSPAPANPANPANPAATNPASASPTPANPAPTTDTEGIVNDAATLAALILFENWQSKGFATPLKVDGREPCLCYAKEREGGKRVYVPLNLTYATAQEKAEAILCTSKDGKKFTPVDGVTAAILKKLDMARKMLGHISF